MTEISRLHALNMQVQQPRPTSNPKPKPKPFCGMSAPSTRLAWVLAAVVTFLIAGLSALLLSQARVQILYQSLGVFAVAGGILLLLNSQCFKRYAGLPSNAVWSRWVSAAVIALSVMSLWLSACLYYFDHTIQSRIDKQFPSEFEGQDIELQGLIVEHSEYDGRFARFHFAIDKANLVGANDSLGFAGKVRLSWRIEGRLAVHENCTFVVRLKRPRGFVNPGGFDYQLWLLSKGLSATGYVRSGECEGALQQAALVKRTDSRAISRYFSSKRESIETRVHKITEQLPNQPFIKALVFGDKSEISAEHWSLFQQTGTIHLMAISGLHIGMLAALIGVLYFPFRKLLSLVIRPSYNRAIALILVTSGCGLYAFLAGFSVPTLRAFICVSLLGLAWLFGIRISFLFILGLVASALVALNPFILLTPGFVLSFAAVAILVLCFSNRVRKTPWWWNFIKAQWVLLIGLMPFLQLLGLPISIVSPAANSIAIPLMTFALLPLLFLGTAISGVSESASASVFVFADHVFNVLFSVLDAVSLPTHNFASATILEKTALAAGAVLLLCPTAFGLRKYGWLLVSFACVFVLAGIQPSTNQLSPKRSKPLEITVLDAGQGLATVVDDGENVLIYDIGAQFSPSFSIANRILMPFIEGLGRRDMYSLVISHADNDHAGGLTEFNSLLSAYLNKRKRPDSEGYKPIMIVSGEADELKVPANSCEAGQRLFHEINASIRVLWPADDTSVDKNSNNKSCVVLIEFQGRSILFTGDVDKDAERQLLHGATALPQKLDVLVAAHHGSNTSSSKAFIERLQPTHVIFSAGYKNRYRHPAIKVQDRFSTQGAISWNTALHGAITVEVAQDSVHVSAARCEFERRWFLDHGLCESSRQHGN